MLSPGGDPTAVIMVERMRRIGPTLEGWSLQIGRGPDADAAISTMMVAGHRVDLGAVELAFEPDPLRARLRVSVFHPDFRVFPLPLSQEIALHKLDFEFGEDTVGRWIGAIDIATIRHETPASAGCGARGDRRARRDAPRRVGDRRRYVGTGAPFVGRVRRTLRWQDHPFLTRQHLLSARYRAQPNGLPTDDEFERLGAIDEALESIGGSAQLVLLVHCAGVRQILLFAREDDVETATALRTSRRRTATSSGRGTTRAGVPRRSSSRVARRGSVGWLGGLLGGCSVGCWAGCSAGYSAASESSRLRRARA